jgi:hypothetical protein
MTPWKKLFVIIWIKVHNILFYMEQMNWFRVENITEVMTPFPTRVLEDGVIPLRFTLNFEKLTYIPQLTFHVQSRGFSELVKEYPVASDGVVSAHCIMG